MNKIPIAFNYQFVNFTGFFRGVIGTSMYREVFHLTINGHYCGMLYHMDEWEFFSSENLFAGLSTVFGKHIETCFNKTHVPAGVNNSHSIAGDERIMSSDDGNWDCGR